MTTAKSALVSRILTVAATETDLQKLAYAAKGTEALLGNSDTDYPGYYGVSWDETADTFARVGSVTAGMALPIQYRMRRCLLNDAGQVVAYLHPSNSLYLDNGTPAALDGSAGQVMVEVPAFWTKYSYVGTTHTWLIADTPLPGFTLHPDYVKDGVEVPYRYYGAYNGVIQSGKLASVSGQYPTVSQSRAPFRNAAAARGSGWRQLTFTQWSAVLLLALVEFAGFDFKRPDRMTNGRTSLSGGTAPGNGWLDGQYRVQSGLSNTLGNGTGGVSKGGTDGWATDFMSYRGIEHFFGHIWQFLDGFTVDGTANDDSTPMPLWFTNNSVYFADTGSTGMVKLADMPNIRPTDEEYVASLMPSLVCGFIPASVGATNTTKARSYLWQFAANAAGWRAPCCGGTATTGSQAAPGSLYLADGSAAARVALGARAGF